VVEHLVERIGARTLFATHFRELTRLADEIPGVIALQTAIERHDGGLVFLHTIVPGVAEAAFGLEIARLAGLPESVIQRARAGAQTTPIGWTTGPQPATAIDLVRERVFNALLAADLANTTPLESLNLLADLQQRLRAASLEQVGPRALLDADDRRDAAQAN
ncbi:MAG TPA: hypothetical protein DCX80_14730, partial [Chloroflexi bacterium]|nr:hypothetical protein [Chloroflexota bacterium]